MAETMVEKRDNVPHRSDDDDVDMVDGDAPEAVSFVKGKEEALQSISSALQDLKRAKSKAKERRREHDRLLKEQKQKKQKKQKKKVSLGKALLPAELLSKLASQKQEPELSGNKSQASERQSTTEDKSPEDDEEDDEDRIHDEEEEEEESTIRVIANSKITHPSPHEAALKFLQNQMYGSRIPRESMEKHVSRKMKRLGKPAMTFLEKQPQGVRKRKKKARRNLAAI